MTATVMQQPVLVGEISTFDELNIDLTNKATHFTQLNLLKVVHRDDVGEDQINRVHSSNLDLANQSVRFQ